MNYLIKKLFISGYIEVLTGLHIGGTNDAMSIGEIANSVIRNPITQRPYIPGSSLKGKMRSLIEIVDNTIQVTEKGLIKNNPSNNPEDLSARLFGYTQFKDENSSYPAQRPSRIIVRDSYLKNEKELRDNNPLITEIKSETVIDRLTSAANPRKLERVPAGAKFELNLILNIFDSTEEDEFVKGILRSLKLIQDDYLGGAGSRGSGQVRFCITGFKEKTRQFYIEGNNSEQNDLLKSGQYVDYFERFEIDVEQLEPA